MSEWRKGLVDKEVYLVEKRDYRKLREKKKEKWNKKLLKKAREAKTQEQIWKVVNRERKRKGEINREIRTEEWEEHFRKILGSENRIKLKLGD